MPVCTLIRKGSGKSSGRRSKRGMILSQLFPPDKPVFSSPPHPQQAGVPSYRPSGGAQAVFRSSSFRRPEGWSRDDGGHRHHKRIRTAGTCGFGDGRSSPGPYPVGRLPLRRKGRNTRKSDYTPPGDGGRNSGAHIEERQASRAVGMDQAAWLFSKLLKSGSQSDGPAPSINIWYRRNCRMMSMGLISTGQASTQA